MLPDELRPLQAASAASEDELRAALDREFAVIGGRAPRVDGAGKLTGRALYTDDLAPPDLLHGKILRSPHAHARIRGIDAATALAWGLDWAKPPRLRCAANLIVPPGWGLAGISGPSKLIFARTARFGIGSNRSFTAHRQLSLKTMIRRSAIIFVLAAA